MKARRPNVRIAAVELAFVFLSGVAGAMAEPGWWAGLFALGNGAHWAWSRRHDLARIAADRRLGRIGTALGLIAAVHATAFWLGRLIGAAG